MSPLIYQFYAIELIPHSFSTIAANRLKCCFVLITGHFSIIYSTFDLFIMTVLLALRRQRMLICINMSYNFCEQ